METSDPLTYGDTESHDLEPAPVLGDTSGLRLGWVEFVLFVLPSARFCLGRWKPGRTGRTARQYGETPQIKVNPTKYQTGCVSL